MNTPARPLLILAACCALLPLAVQAADTTPPPPPPPPPRPAAAPAPASTPAPTPVGGPPYGTIAPSHPLAGAQTLLRGGRWGAALEELRRINATGDADWNNLMGYALRKQATPDLEGAQRHYDAALRINPQHLGALEYAGELALMKKDLATAEAHLARLQQLCGAAPCEPLAMLREAVGRYKAGR